MQAKLQKNKAKSFALNDFDQPVVLLGLVPALELEPEPHSIIFLAGETFFFHFFGPEQKSKQLC